jgi:hypothetical protein
MVNSPKKCEESTEFWRNIKPSFQSVNFVLILYTIFALSKFYKHEFCHVTCCANEISLFYIEFQNIFKSVINFLAL